MRQRDFSEKPPDRHFAGRNDRGSATPVPRTLSLTFDVGQLARVEAAILSVRPELADTLGHDLHLVGYHHCPSLCQCSRSPLYVFGLDTSPFHRGLAANLLSSLKLRDALDSFGSLGWSTCSNPPCPLRIGAWTHDGAGGSESDSIIAPSGDDERRGWLVPVYGPYARKGFFILEYQPNGVPPALSDELLSGLTDFHIEMSRKTAMNDRRAELTQREIDVTRWIVYGKSNPVIAEILDLSAHTVNGYLRRIYLKTGTADRVSLAIYAVNHGFV